MAIGDIQVIQDGTVTTGIITLPVLKVMVVPGLNSNPDLLRYSYNVTNMTETMLFLKLEFENPV